jgi:UDP-N-acetylglucosamine 2-epimerase (non-hydrolysing)
MRSVKLLHVVGARPNFMKVAPLMAAVECHNSAGREPRFEQLLVHTGQHYDHAMSGSFFSDLAMPAPDINLGVGSGSHAEQTGKIMIAFEAVLVEHSPDLVIVVGDVNSTVACTLTAKKLNIPVAHVESGLRSRDMTMPEEINRKVTDCLADYLFTTDRYADQNLLDEGIPPEQIFFVGNVMVDTLLRHREKAQESSVLKHMGLHSNGLVEPYALLTLHRPSNVDEPGVLREICEALDHIAKSMPVIFPCHPRTSEQLKKFGLAGRFGSSIRSGDRLICLEPLGYLDFLRVSSQAAVILTDSGGIQEESTILGVPCLTLRENTERPVTVTDGTNRICGNTRGAILTAFNESLGVGKEPLRHPDKWDGKAAERIVGVLKEVFLNEIR